MSVSSVSMPRVLAKPDTVPGKKAKFVNKIKEIQTLVLHILKNINLEGGITSEGIQKIKKLTPRLICFYQEVSDLFCGSRLVRFFATDITSLNLALSNQNPKKRNRDTEDSPLISSYIEKGTALVKSPVPIEVLKHDLTKMDYQDFIKNLWEVERVNLKHSFTIDGEPLPRLEEVFNISMWQCLNETYSEKTDPFIDYLKILISGFEIEDNREKAGEATTRSRFLNDTSTTVKMLQTILNYLNISWEISLVGEELSET